MKRKNVRHNYNCALSLDTLSVFHYYVVGNCCNINQDDSTQVFLIIVILTILHSALNFWDVVQFFKTVKHIARVLFVYLEKKPSRLFLMGAFISSEGAIYVRMSSLSLSLCFRVICHTPIK